MFRENDKGIEIKQILDKVTTVERNKLSIRDKHFNKSARESPPPYPPPINIPSHTNWALTVNKHWPLWGSAHPKTVPRDPARRNVENVYTGTAARDKNPGLRETRHVHYYTEFYVEQFVR